MNNKILIGIIIGVVVIGGATLFATQSNNTQTASETNQVAMQDKEKMTQEGAMMEKEEGSMMMEKIPSTDQTTNSVTPPPTAVMAKHGSYKEYSTVTVASEQEAKNKVVLFFHATWCPFCKAADAAFKAKLEEIPSGVTVLKTDYDSNPELKKKYGVTYQHTFVQIDANGNMVTKWNGGDLDSLNKYIK